MMEELFLSSLMIQHGVLSKSYLEGDRFWCFWRRETIDMIFLFDVNVKSLTLLQTLHSLGGVHGCLDLLMMLSLLRSGLVHKMKRNLHGI